jgi:hypothetical protein
MIVYIPDDNYDEGAYVTDFLLGELLGLTYSIKKHDAHSGYLMELKNKSRIIIEKHVSFYNNNYLDEKNIPETIIFATHSFFPEKNIPVIFGTDKMIITPHQIICGIDIFASVFFMLTRWEEYVTKTRDIHNRFPAKASLAYQAGFLHRPIINEYAEMLYTMLIASGCTGKRKKQRFTIIPTHDVDEIYFRCSIKNIAGDILKRKHLQGAFIRLKSRMKKENHYDTFDWLMDVSEKHNLKSRFYFLSGGTSVYDNMFSLDDPFVHSLIKKINDRGHIIGFHPSYNAYNDAGLFLKEKKKLETLTRDRITEGRNHFLRCELPRTWNIWDEQGMKIDSTLSYHDHAGFRCGTADEFPVFDFINKKVLAVRERPLIVMDVSLWSYQGLSLEECMEKLWFYKSVCQKYSMPYTILFHNSSFNPIHWPGWKEVYENIFNSAPVR